MSMPEASTPSASAVLPLMTICGSVDRSAGIAVLEVEVRLGPGEAGLEQRTLVVDDLRVLLAEDAARSARARAAGRGCRCCTACPSTNMFLPRRGSVTSARHSRLERNLDDAVAGLLAASSTRLDVRRDDRRVAVLAPHALEQDRRAGLQLAGAHAAEQHLLVEGDHEVGLVAAVGDALASRCGCGCRSRRRRCAPAAGSRPG